MDNKNVFIAIALSMSVLLFWGAFFETPKNTNKTVVQKKIGEKVENISPNINTDTILKSISRTEAINNTKRIKIENNNIVGSISLKGALIDDVSFKNHKENLIEGKNISFLNPKQTDNGFFIETGWTSIGNKIAIPSNNSVWTVIGNNVLSNDSPVLLEWENNKGIIFKKKN